MKLSTLSTALNRAIQAIRYFKSSNVRTGALTAAAIATGETRISLKLPGKTRWQGKVEAISSLLANKAYIQAVISNRTQCLGHRISALEAANWELLREQLHEYRFWEQLDALQRFLKPFLEVTIALESNCPRGSRIYAYFNYLLEMSSPASLPREEILTIITKRWLSLAHPLFTVAYICDPAARDDRKVGIHNGTRDKMANWLGTRYPEEGVAASILRELLDCWGR